VSDVAVLVPACGDLGTKTLGPAPLFSGDPLALPVGGRLAIDLVREYYATELPNARIVLALDADAFRRTWWRPLTACTRIDVGPTASICDTIARALDRLDEAFVIVNPITTIPTACLHPHAAIGLGREAIHRENWSAVAFDERGTPAFHHRDAERSGEDPRPAFPFTGLLSAPRETLQRHLRGIVGPARGDLLHLAERLHDDDGNDDACACEFTFTEWIDAGHRETHARSRQAAITSRAFNRIGFLAGGTLVEKRSRERRRLEAEGRYLAALPTSLRHHFPALQHSGPDGADGWRLVQEYVPFPTLAETFLHWNVGPNAWARILDRLADMLDAFAASSDPVVGDGSWLYSAKCRDRREQLRAEVANGRLARIGPLLEREFTVNGRPMPSLERSMETLIERLQPLERELRLQRIHGDLCLNNILCDPMVGLVTLIDPRGREDLATDGTVDEAGTFVDPAFGDRRYDLAKLNHSFEGLYDAVVNDLFTIDVGDGVIALEIHRPPNHRFLLDRFRDRILHPAIDEETTAVLTASLFLSMLPLHAEDLERTAALASIGSVLLHERSMRTITGEA
jgi:hypothetical protein